MKKRLLLLFVGIILCLSLAGCKKELPEPAPELPVLEDDISE